MLRSQVDFPWVGREWLHKTQETRVLRQETGLDGSQHEAGHASLLPSVLVLLQVVHHIPHLVQRGNISFP